MDSAAGITFLRAFSFQGCSFGTAIRLMLATITGFSAAACQDQQFSQDRALAPEVAVISVVEAPITLTKELPGRITAIRTAEVRARVAGIIIERTFTQGSVVEAGSILYRIEPAPYEAELERARATLARAEAALFQASRQEERIRTLASSNAASQAQYELALAANRQAEAEVAVQKAAVRLAQLNLDYTTVRAPISGRIGRGLVTEGALVGQTEATHLATIQQLDPIYADFTQSVGELNQLKREFAQGRLKAVATDTAGVRLLLDDGSAYGHLGRLLFSDVTVDPGTAKVTLRGEFPNPKAELLPGMYVRVQIEEGIDMDGIVVPTQAVQRTTGGGSAVFVINDEGRAVLKPVRAGRILGTQILIEDGLKPGYRVVVEGFQKFTPNSVVRPVPWSEVATAADALN